MSDFDAVRERLANHLTEMSTIQRDLTAISSRLETTLPGGEDEIDLARLLELRRDCSRRLGATICQWIALGGGIDFREPPSSVDEVVAQMGDPAETLSPAVQEAIERWPEEEEKRVEVAEAIFKPAPEPASPLAISLLQAAWASGANTIPNEPTNEERLQEILKPLGPPLEIRALSDFYREMDSVRRALEGREAWIELPASIQQGLVGLLAARGRHLQDMAPKFQHPIGAENINGVFYTLTAFSAQYRPGFVRGLKRDQPSTTGSWIEDARQWWAMLSPAPQPSPVIAPGTPNPESALADLYTLLEVDEPVMETVVPAVLACLAAKVSVDDPRLVKALRLHLPLLTKEPKFKALRKTIREYQAELDAEEGNEEHIPEGWHLLKQTKGKYAAIFGNDRQDRIEAITLEMGFRDVAWDTGRQIRKVEAMVKQILDRKVDFAILFVRWLSHKVWEKVVDACRATDTPFVIVERGCSVIRTKMAFEATFPTAL